MIVPFDHSIVGVMFARQSLCVEFADGRTVSAPLEWFPALAAARADRRDGWEIVDGGAAVVWVQLGEKISSTYLLARR